jgi:hypothetical protein
VLRRHAEVWALAYKAIHPNACRISSCIVAVAICVHRKNMAAQFCQEILFSWQTGFSLLVSTPSAIAGILPNVRNFLAKRIIM